MHVREIDGETLDFGVSGRLWKDALIMYDRPSKSLWSHVTGECLEGKYQGKKLKALDSVLMPFSEWAELYPNSLVLTRPEGSDKGSNYDSYVTSKRLGIFGTQAKRSELEPKALVQGVAYQGDAIAISFDYEWGEDPVPFVLDGQAFEARWENGAVRISKRLGEDKLEPYPSTTAYWFAWINFYPEARVVK